MDADDDFRYDELDNQIIEAITCSGAYWEYEQRKAIRRLIEQEIAKARLEELKSALYVYENQVPYQHALAGALGGAEKDLSEGILVEFDGSKKVVTGDVNFKLPHFFNDRIAELKKELEKYE